MSLLENLTMAGPLSLRWLRRIASAILAISLPVACARQGPSANAPPPPTVTVVEAKRQDVPQIANPIATTRALKEVSIRARVRGFLLEQHFTEGSDVEQGQLLFVIETDPFQAKVDSAQAQLDQAAASLERSRHSKAREIAKAQLALDQAQLDLAKIEETRKRSLLRRNAGTAEDVDQAEANRRRYEAQVDADAANFEQAKADYDVNLQAASAALEAAKAALESARIDLRYCRMVAPISGRIGEARVKLGNLVGPAAGGQDYTELATIQQLDPMGIDIQASSRHLDEATRLVRKGLAIQIYRPGVEGEHAHPYVGKTFFLDNRIDPATSTFLIKAEVANPKHNLLPGEYVKADITIGHLRGAIVVPEPAIVETQAGPTVYTVDSGGKVAIVPVKAGVAYNGLRVIQSGLEPGRTVIVDGIQMVRPGMAVQVERAKSSQERGATGG
jgi:RND family efflux transporter MFP subunit